MAQLTITLTTGFKTIYPHVEFHGDAVQLDYRYAVDINLDGSN